MDTLEELSADRAAQLNRFARALIDAFGARSRWIVEAQVRLAVEQWPSAGDIWRLLGASVVAQMERDAGEGSKAVELSTAGCTAGNPT